MDNNLIKIVFMSYLVLGANVKVTLKVSNDITVKPTSDSLTDVTDIVNVTLRCEGSKTDLAYYISNPVSWTFISANCTHLPLTEGFFPTQDAKHLFFGTDKRFTFNFVDTETGFAFDINITKVARSDEGIYRCSLKTDDGYMIDSKDVKLTVDNPVQTVTTERNLVAESGSPAMQTTSSLPDNIRSTTPSQSSKPRTLEDLKMEYYRQAIALQKVQVECFSKASKLADILIDKFS